MLANWASETVQINCTQSFRHYWQCTCRWLKAQANNDKIRASWVNTLRPRQNGRHFADDIFKCIFLNKNVWISIKISLKFVPKGPINNIPALVEIMAWRRPGDKPLSEPMMVNLLTHICVSRPQWVKTLLWGWYTESNVHWKCAINYKLYRIRTSTHVKK